MVPEFEVINEETDVVDDATNAVWVASTVPEALDAVIVQRMVLFKRVGFVLVQVRVEEVVGVP